ncbi:MAG: hypothetical protein JWN56_8 [Sphingobacteriales bacterium]|nr:hypothetical protein [Sphingobacteriales bacterium]
MTSSLNKFFSLVIALIAVSASLFGQPQEYRADLNRVFSQQYQHQMMNRMMTRSWLNNANYLVNEKYDFEVHLNDGTKQIVKSKIYTDTIAHQSYLEYINKSLAEGDSRRITRIYPSKTSKIIRIIVPLHTNEFEPAPRPYAIEGLSSDSCWRFKVISGKISAFSFLSEQYDLNTFYLNAFQFNNGEIQPLDPEKLKNIIQSDGKAMKYFQKKDYYGAILRYNKQSKD